ncbi:large ribosomal subunit protein uL11-like [Sycon ciliatum]|uniref:large ribosomal subunit protein uL11-like n=1 Tax=Sycon ciliatum TaxID=27933 RepID=UPI0020A8B290|eukprot:scpid89918/ scgid23461/ Probable 39S ribosomal protein L11, mitochondrial
MSKSGKKAVKLINTFRITIPANQAAPAPPLGPALGQKGVNLGKFCKEFNERTSHFIDGAPIPTDIDVYSDRSFKMVTRQPITAWFLKNAAGIEKGAARASHEIVGRVNIKQIYEIARIKQKNNIQMEMQSLEEICGMIIRQAWRMGLDVVDETKEMQA